MIDAGFGHEQDVNYPGTKCQKNARNTIAKTVVSILGLYGMRILKSGEFGRYIQLQTATVPKNLKKSMTTYFMARDNAMKCDLNCPNIRPSNGTPQVGCFLEQFCCSYCAHSRKSFLNEGNKQYWTDALGFWSSSGCKLPRDEMPKACKGYDCKKYRFYMSEQWDGQRWIQISRQMVLKEECDAEFVKAYNSVFKDKVERNG